MKIRNTIFGAGLWVFAAGAGALSLGGSRGTVVLGAPLDVSFEVQPDPGSDVASSCVSAQVRAGDTPIGDARVRVTPLPDMRGRPPGVRVQASGAIDEPVLTVTLSAGCSSKITRTYTFLSELPPTVARSTSPVDVARLSSAPVSPPDTARAATGTNAAAGAGAGSAAQRAATGAAPDAAPNVVPNAASGTPPTRAAAASRPSAPRAAANPAPARSVPPRQPAAATPKAAERSRLVVEPLDLWLDRPVALRTSPELLVTPSDQPSAQRAQAAAVWKSLNAQPEDINQDAERLKAQEAEMAALRAQANRERTNAAQVQQQLEQVQEERFPAMVVYVLGGLLAAALLLVAWVLVRLRTNSEKAIRDWRDSVAVMGGRDPALAAREQVLGLTPHPGDTWLPPDTTPAAVQQAATAAAPSARTPGPSSGAAPLAPSLADTKSAPSATAPTLASLPAAAPAPTAGSVPAASPATASQTALHIVSPEELFDIQQQAEFFISVGEHQQAIEVLKKHIAERGDVSPLAYLELLRLYHTLSRVDEFAQLRKQFMQSFNAQVPEFTGFHRTGRMLYHYTDALAEIEAEWTSPSVMALLEKFLFRRGGVGAIEPFDMAAYDELLLLLAIAQTTPASARGDATSPRQRTTPLAPDRMDSVVMPEPPAQPVSRRDELPLDSLAASLEFEFDESLRTPRAVRATEPPAATQPAEARPAAPTVETDSRGMPLDLDLSEPPHLTLSDLPPVPVTPAPPSGGAVGFGMDNDLMELRLELEQKDNNTKGRP